MFIETLIELKYLFFNFIFDQIAHMPDSNRDEDRIFEFYPPHMGLRCNFFYLKDILTRSIR